MKANQTKVEDFLSANKTQFIIPVYQRNYDWSRVQCKQLLDDILEVGINKKMQAHFIGSIVYVHDDDYTATRIKELTVIDGQQRLTTLTLLYVVLYRLAKELGKEELVSEISETYLINKFASEEEKLKLRPTENNDRALQYLLRSDENEEFSEFSNLVENFDYFKSQISEENYQSVLNGISKLIFVEISLDRVKDSPQRIFESLNSTGLDLSQSDLIRNYILMGLKPKDQTRVYKHYWEIIEKLAKDETLNISRVSDYIRDYLTLKNKNIPNKGKVYLEFKSRYPTLSIEELEGNLKEIKKFAQHYNKLINPKREENREIRLQLEYIKRLEINVTFPFLIKVYDDYSSSIIDKATFLKILNFVQSFTWRRFILGLPTNALNKIFMNLYDSVDSAHYLHSVQKALLQKSGVQRFPKDAEVKEAFKIKDVYNIKPKNRNYLLELLENFENTEKVYIEDNPDITIEHIFPINPDPEWEKDLSNEDYKFIKENYLHTIANLTLSGNNRELSNKSFKEKRDKSNAGYGASRLSLNKYLADLEKWDKVEIEKRFELIAERFLKIWEYPDTEFETDKTQKEVNIFDADDPTSKKLEYAIFFDKKIEIESGPLANFYVEIFKQLFELQPETFFASDLGKKIGLTKNEKELRKAAPISDTYFIDSHNSSKEKFDRIKHALTIFGLEDELTIKYSE